MTDSVIDHGDSCRHRCPECRMGLGTHLTCDPLCEAREQLRPELPTQADLPPFATGIRAILADIGDLLIAKNEAYGDAALNPVRIFSTTDSLEQLRVRIDDKLSRIARGTDAGEDVITDLIGYLVIYKHALNQTEPPTEYSFRPDTIQTIADTRLKENNT